MNIHWRTNPEAPILWSPDAKNWLVGKDPDAGKDWRQEVKGTTEDEMVGWHHQLNGHEFHLALGVGDGQGSLACCNPWGCKESDTTEHLNWTWNLYENILLSRMEMHSEDSILFTSAVSRTRTMFKFCLFKHQICNLCQISYHCNVHIVICEIRLILLYRRVLRIKWNVIVFSIMSGMW